MTGDDSGADKSLSTSLKELIGLKATGAKGSDEPYEIALDGYPVIEYYDDGRMVVDPTAHEDAEIVGAVPIEELEALADAWAAEREDREANTLSNVATLAKEQCAQELREIIEDYE